MLLADAAGHEQGRPPAPRFEPLGNRRRPSQAATFPPETLEQVKGICRCPRTPADAPKQASLQTRTQNNFRTPRSMTNEGNGQGRSKRGAPGPRRTGELTRFGEVVAQVRGVLAERVIVSPALGHD
jgi:hypothetical protein